MVDGSSAMAVEAETRTPLAGPIPTPGQIVMYRLSGFDVVRIYERRDAQETRGNSVNIGDAFPMVIVRAWGNTPTSVVNGHLFLDGPDTAWITSVAVGEGPGSFYWPVTK